MSRDIELVKRLSQEIGHEIEIRPQPGRDSPEYRAFAKERDALIQKLRSKPGRDRPLFNSYTELDGAHGSNIWAWAIIDEDDRVVRLYLNGVPLEEIPSTLFELQSIEFLCLHRNRSQHLPAAIRSLTGLNALYCGGNSKLRELPSELGGLPQLVEASFVELPELSVPPQKIAEQGIGGIRNYFDSLRSSERVDYLYEAKMVLVGRGFAGKTSLVRKLTRPGYHLEEHIPSTEGIAIDTWDLKMPLENSDRFRFNIWDFAGQEKYDATHQFFITERTLYLFVTEARQESNYLDFDYWLNIVDMLGNKSPVIVVQNKIDERKKALPSERYRAQFPNIVDFVDVSCADGYEETLATLRRSIEHAVSRLPQVGDQLPTEWVAVRKDLEALEADHIPYDAYRKICSKRGLTEEKADYLSRYFHDLGVIVHYAGDPLLKKIVVVNPDWAVDGVYNVLDTPAVEHKQGRFDHRDLEQIWRDEKYADKHPELLALMKNYEICFELGSTGIFIAPELLPANPVPYKPIKKAGRLTFVYRYTFMPAGLLSRFIVKIHRLIDGDCFWRSGVVVRYEDARALVVEDETSRMLRIDIEGGEAKREILAIIREKFAEIYADFNRRIDYDELIPCPCDGCGARIEEDEEPHYFNWGTVKRYGQEDIPKIRCENSLAEVDVSALMGDIAEKPGLWSAEFPRRADAAARIATGAGSRPSRETVPVWQVVTTGVIGVGFVLLLLTLAIFIPEPTDFQALVFRVVLALAAAGVGALIPGFLDVKISNWLRATGAIALFALVYLVNPPALIANHEASIQNEATTDSSSVSP